MGLINKWINTHLVTLLKIWVILFTATVIYLVVTTRDLADQAATRANENTELIKQMKETQAAIQRSKLESCVSIHNILLTAFAPFEPKKDDPATPRDEVQDFKTFTDNIKTSKSNCSKPVKPKKQEKKKK